MVQIGNDKYKISTTSSELVMDVLGDECESEPLESDLLRVKMREELLSRNLAKQKLMLVTWAENKRQGDIFTRNGIYDQFMDQLEEAKFHRKQSMKMVIEWATSAKVEPCVDLIFDFLPLETFYVRRHKKQVVHAVVMRSCFCDYISYMLIVQRQMEDTNHFLDNYSAYKLALESHIHETSQAMETARRKREFLESAGLQYPDTDGGRGSPQKKDLTLRIGGMMKTKSELELAEAIKLSMQPLSNEESDDMEIDEQGDDALKMPSLSRTRSEVELELAIKMSLEENYKSTEVDLSAPPLKKHKSVEQIEFLRDLRPGDLVTSTSAINPIHIESLCQKTNAPESKVIEALKRNGGDQVMALLDLKLGYSDPKNTFNVSIRFDSRPFCFLIIPGTDYNNAFVHMIWHDSLYKDGLKLKSRVIRINGWDVTGRSYASIVKALESSTLPCVVDFKTDQWMDKMPHFPTERFQKRSSDLEMALKMSMDLEEDMESSDFNGYDTLMQVPEFVSVLNTFTSCEFPKTKLLAGTILKVVLRKQEFIVANGSKITARISGPDLKNIGPCTKEDIEHFQREEELAFQEATRERIYDPADHAARQERKRSSEKAELNENVRKKRFRR